MSVYSRLSWGANNGFLPSSAGHTYPEDPDVIFLDTFFPLSLIFCVHKGVCRCWYVWFVIQLVTPDAIVVYISFSFSIGCYFDHNNIGCFGGFQYGHVTFYNIHPIWS